jgi:hypothetical protein
VAASRNVIVAGAGIGGLSAALGREEGISSDTVSMRGSYSTVNLGTCFGCPSFAFLLCFLAAAWELALYFRRGLGYIG